jgi:peroxiredoxin
MVDAQTIDTKQLLNTINKSANELPYGTYNLHNNYAKIAIADSNKSSSVMHCAFKKQVADTLAGYQLTSINDYGLGVIYDGNNMYTRNGNTLEIIDGALYPTKIKELKNMQSVYPLFKYINNQLQRYTRDTMVAKLKITTTIYHGQFCYQIVQTDAIGNKGVTVEVSYYVTRQTNIPIGQLIKMEYTTGQIKETRIYDEYITDLKLFELTDNVFSKDRFTGYARQVQYNPKMKDDASPLLAIGSLAPNWELPLITGNKIKLSDLKGKVVVMDFWFKACIPCQQQMVDLQKLYTKYNKAKVVFIGVNTIDDLVKGQLKLFLEKRNITMPSAYNGKAVEKQYQAYSSPALFVIDKDGKVVYAKEGYEYTLEKDLSALLDASL